MSDALFIFRLLYTTIQIIMQDASHQNAAFLCDFKLIIVALLKNKSCKL